MEKKCLQNEKMLIENFFLNFQGGELNLVNSAVPDLPVDIPNSGRSIRYLRRSVFGIGWTAG